MITRKDLCEYFDLQVKENSEKEKHLKEMDLEACIAERKAIKDLTLDTEFKEISSDGKIYLLHVVENLSDFKDGESVCLCRQDNNRLICECNIHDFRECGDVEIIVNPYNYTSELDNPIETKLYLQAKPADMMSFYCEFCANNKFYEKDYFENHLINNHKKPKLTPFADDERNSTKEAGRDMFGVELNDNQVEAFIHAEHAEDYFLIQGPPGSGKSFLSALILVYLFMAEKKRIVIVGPTHRAVNNVLQKVAEVLLKVYTKNDLGKALVKGRMLKIGQSYNAKGLEVTAPDGEVIEIANVTYSNVSFLNNFSNDEGVALPWIVGMTPYSLQSRRAKGLEFDLLFVDEAGQLTIPVAWMAMVEPKKVIFAGDHKQLPPIVSEKTENEEFKHSIFEHLCDKENSVLLDVSFRMNGVICDLVSDLFYEGKLKSFNSEKRLKTNLTEPLYASEYPIVLHNSEHNGKQFSKEEAESIVTIISKYIAAGVAPSDIAVLAPFRAQCALIRRMLASQDTIPAELRKEIVIDTVDRMQGQEREIIIYSFTSGDPSYMADKQDFLYNPNKLNVAFSRAKNKLILIANVASLRELSNPLVNQILDYPTIHKL